MEREQPSPLQEVGTRLRGERVEQTWQRGWDAEGCGVLAFPTHDLVTFTWST